MKLAFCSVISGANNNYTVMNEESRLLPKEILKEPFGLLTSKVRSPSHFSRSPGVWEWGVGEGSRKLWKFRGGA